MDFKEYTVKVYANGDKYWYLDGKYHREDGPAIEYADGDKEWYLDGKELSEKEFNEEMATKKTGSPCAGKVVLIDGKKYKLEEV